MGAMKDHLFGDTVYSYSRQDALNDGVLVNLNQFIPIKESPFKYPVACTNTVFNIIEQAVNNKKYCNDFKGVVWDIMYMASHGHMRKLNESTVLFKVIITGTGKKKYHEFKCLCHPGDQGEPVLTIMLPEED